MTGRRLRRVTSGQSVAAGDRAAGLIARGESPEPEGLEPVSLARTNLKDQVAIALKTAILTGRLRPGTTYKSGELAKMYGASRTPVREAILELESKGLVDVIRGVGFRVAVPSAAEERDTIQIREILETWAVATVAGTLSADAVGQARRMIADLGPVAARNDLATYLGKDKAFHTFLVAQAGNGRLAELVEELRDSQRAPALAKLADAGTLSERNDQHSKMLDALVAGDAALAADLIRRHIGLNRKAYEDLVR